MDVANNVMGNDHGPVPLRNFAPNNYKRNVRSMSFCPPSSTYLLQRPQMRPYYGDVNIIDLTSENKKCPPMRKSKSTVSKPSVTAVPEHHKGRRLSKYLGIHRMSLSGFSSESSKNKSGAEESGKSILRRFSKSGIEDGTKSLGRKYSKKHSGPHIEPSGPDIEPSGTETLSKHVQQFESNPTEGFEADETDWVPNCEDNLEISHSSSESFNSISIRKDIIASREKNGSPPQETRVKATTMVSKNALSENIDSPKISSLCPKNFVHHSTSIRTVQPSNGKTKQIYSTLSYREKFDLTCKVVLLGDSGVGKTCLLMKFKDGAFLSGSYISTVGIDFRNKVVNIDGSKVKLQIWDTAGQERFRSVTHAYYRDAHALLLLYDVTSKTTFDNTRAWLAEVHEYAQDDVVIMLIGNKCDAPFSERQVRKEDGERLSREYNVTFMETSAKTGLNVDLAFNAVARDLKARKSDNIYEKNFNVSDYVHKEAKTESCMCNIG